MPNDRPPKWTPAEWKEANALLLARSHGSCEVCGQRLETLDSPRTVRHHRQRRAVGGDRIANLILIHGSCHTDLHAHPEKAREFGWIVSVYVDDPANVPIHHATRGVVTLDDIGTAHPVAPSGATSS